MNDVRIGAYEYTPATCRRHDPRTADVAAVVAELLRADVPNVRVEHVGSTAVPGCDGKGVVDLAAIYPDGQLEQARDAVDALGFQHQFFGDPFPETRPMRVGSLRLDGRLYRIHIHILAASSPEVDALLTFRDRLRADHALMAAYIDRKRDILDAGVRESPEYAIAKGGFIHAVLHTESASSQPG